MDVDQLARLKKFPPFNEATLMETHISWVFLTNDFAYKIKKPVDLGFLDFTTLEKRRYYCFRELMLNRRLAPNIYEAVVPIYESKDYIGISGTKGNLVEYTVRMKRLDNAYRLDKCLKSGQVSIKLLGQLAHQIAQFHKRAEVATEPFSIHALQADFAGILQVTDWCRAHLGKALAQNLEDHVSAANNFLENYADRLQERYQLGYVIDGHGDLHARNIFLTDPPVVFDCIEFSDHLRQVDMLDELAFLCLDFDFYRQETLEESFLAAYTKRNNIFIEDADQLIFIYFKWYRANVRFKVAALAQQQKTNSLESQSFQLFIRYAELMEDYRSLLQC